MYRLMQNDQTLAQEDSFQALWPKVIQLCGHMTLDNFSSRGYKIIAPKTLTMPLLASTASSKDRQEYAALAEQRAAIPLNDVERSEEIRRKMVEIAYAYRRYTGRHIADDINDSKVEEAK